MPFTPFHLGPAAVAKCVAPGHFSFMVFGGSQVLMDIEPGVRMIVGSSILHGPSHTIAGAIVIGIIATLLGKPISEFALRLIKYPDAHVSWIASLTGAFFGTASHIVLDAVMHADMQPWAPFDAGNALLGIVSVNSLHIFCAVTGVLGGILIALRSTFATDKQAEQDR